MKGEKTQKGSKACFLQVQWDSNLFGGCIFARQDGKEFADSPRQFRRFEALRQAGGQELVVARGAGHCGLRWRAAGDAPNGGRAQGDGRDFGQPREHFEH